MIISNKLKTVLLKDIKPQEKNVKVHTPEQIQFIKKLILEKGYYNPIGIDKNNKVVVGNGRYFAMIEIDPNMEIQVFDHSDKSAKQIRELMIQDNQSQNLTGWDEDNLFFQLKTLYNDIDSNYDSILEDMKFDENLIDKMNKKDSTSKELKPKIKDPKESSGKVKHKYICKSCDTELVCPNGCEE